MHTLTVCSLLIYLGSSSLVVSVFAIYELMDTSIISESNDDFLTSVQQPIVKYLQRNRTNLLVMRV